MKGQELKYRIAGVRETVKITKAMQMISTSKMYRTQQIYDTSKYYLQEVKKSIRLLMTPEVKDHPYFDTRKGDLRIAYVVISGDKGLCGDFNSLVFDAVKKDMANRNVVNIFAIGRMTVDYFKKTGQKFDKSYVYMMQSPMPEDAKVISEDLIKIFIEKQLDKVYLVFTEFETLSKQHVTIKKILPVNYVQQKTDTPVITGKEKMSRLLNQYVTAEIYYALVSSSLAYNYKSMVSMQQSTNNGEEIIEDLTKQYNHKRQESITTELLDTSTALLGRKI